MEEKYEYNRLVPDDTVHMVTSKFHKVDKNNHFANAHLSVNFGI